MSANPLRRLSHYNFSYLRKFRVKGKEGVLVPENDLIV